jgi:hypothetical protein
MEFIMSVINVDGEVKEALDKIKYDMQQKKQTFIRYNDVVVFLLHRGTSKEIDELKSCLKIVEKQLRETDKKYANCNRDLKEYQEYFRLQKKLRGFK